MTSELPMAGESEVPNAETDAPQSASARQPWLTRVAIVACIVIFLGIHSQDDPNSWETFAKFGSLHADEIWDGGYWALVTSAFVHFEMLHLVFNLYWLWVLGSRLEIEIGSLKYLAFFVISAFVSSSFQLAASDDTGIGASGVLYAIFGFMWATRSRYPPFYEVLDSRTVQLLVGWLFVCIGLTYLDVWNVGNAAHFSGLIFGGAVAGAFFVSTLPRLMVAGLTAIVVLSIVPLFWCPWSITWVAHKAYSAQVAGRHDVAIERYTQVIEMDPSDAWAYEGRSFSYEELGQFENAERDWQKAVSLDPSLDAAQ